MSNLGQTLLIPARGVVVAGASGSEPPAFVNASTGTSLGTSIPVAKPTGVQEGDLLIAFWAGDQPGAMLPSVVGFTDQNVPTSVAGVEFNVFLRTATASEGASYAARDLEFSASAIRCTILAYRPAAGTTLTVESLTLQDNPSGTSQATAAITPTGDNAMIVVAGAAGAGLSWTPPDGMTERSDAGTNLSIGVFDVVQETAAEITETATLSSAAVAVMAILALTPG